MRRLTLRTRLITMVVVLAAGGLLALAAITYVSQRRYELRRVDDQTSTALRAIDNALDERLGLRGPSGDDGDGGFADNADLPAGTFGQRRSHDGRAIQGDVVITYGKEAPPAPKLPAVVRDGALFTAKAGRGDLTYRVRAVDQPDAMIIVAVPLREVDDALERLLLQEAAVIGGVLAALALLTTLLVRREIRPLLQIAQTADAIAAGDLDRRVEISGPRTEVGRVGLALNGMLGRLERSFGETKASEERLRRFLADAAHELRTPLVSIRGYAELFRMGGTTEPKRMATALRRIEEESERMGILVDDLLMLARLNEQPQNEQTVVDVASLLEDSAADAEAMDPTREVDVRVDGDALVVGDSNALRQVLTNLVRNAVVHTPAGTPLQLSCERDGTTARLRVRDHGPGLPTDHPAELFERFSPGDRAGQARTGSGLGLSIAAAIAQAHGGQVVAADADGGGAVFDVVLPLYAGPAA